MPASEPHPASTRPAPDARAGSARARAPRAGRGQPAARRRPRHAAPLGRRGPRPGLHDARRPSPVRASGAGAARRRRGAPARPATLAGLGATPDRPVRRLSPPLRRDATRGAPDPRATVPAAEREPFRELGPEPRRRRSSASSTRRAPPAPPPSARRSALAAELGERDSRATACRSPTRSRCSSPPAARSSRSSAAAAAPPGRGRARRRPTCTTPRPGLLDRLLLAFVATAHGAPDRAVGRPTAAALPSRALTSILAFLFALMLLDQWRERRQGFQLVWALGHAVVRDRRRARRRSPPIGGWNEALYRAWYLTGAVWTAGWLGLGHGVPARPDAVRLHVRASCSCCRA